MKLENLIKKADILLGGDGSIDYKITAMVRHRNRSLSLCLFEGGGIKSAFVYYDLGGAFFMTDWQGARPEVIDDIEDFSWIYEDGTPAVMFDGVPCLLAQN